MKISKLFTKWFTKTGKDDKTTSRLSDYKKRIREKQDEERDRLERWRKELKQRMNNNYTYSNSIGHMPGSITSNTITTTSIADSAITIDGSGDSVSVNRPLVVNDRDILKELDEMRDALLLLKRDVDMEAKYPRLRELKDEYERALEKYKTFETIKESK